jgi:hypothetical protein
LPHLRAGAVGASIGAMLSILSSALPMPAFFLLASKPALVLNFFLLSTASSAINFPLPLFILVDWSLMIASFAVVWGVYAVCGSFIVSELRSLRS